jgi:hypothetical protein
MYNKHGIKGHIWRKHTEEGQKFNPNKGYSTGTRVVWNKGLTKETDIRVAQMLVTYDKNFREGKHKRIYTRHKDKPPFIMGQYLAIFMPEHPKANSSGAVYVHFLVAEKILGRPIVNESIHHIDENKLNNNEDNILVFKTNADHIRFHRLLDRAKLILNDDGTYSTVFQNN